MSIMYLIKTLKEENPFVYLPFLPIFIIIHVYSYRAASLLIENGADCMLKGSGGFSAQQLVDTFNITCCRHIMKSNLTLPMLTKATKTHLK